MRVAGEEEEIGDCFERIVDFVGDGGREATDDSEFLRLAQGFFRLLLGVDVSIGAERRRHDRRHRVRDGQG